MTDRAKFEELVRDALAAPFEGWDFSWLNGRRTEFTLPWDYCDRVRAGMSRTTSLLDMGTGGGEILASLAPLPAHVCATETYPPNVGVARKRLEPLGVRVFDTRFDPESRSLPFNDAEFDLVINRHESYTPTEVARVLKLGGFFITQQCGGHSEANLIEYLKGKIEPKDWTADVACRHLREAGFEIADSQEVCPEYSFLDVGAVVYTLRAIPWLLDDFAVEKYRDRLLAMHEHIRQHGSFAVRAQRFFIEATKPTLKPTRV